MRSLDVGRLYNNSTYSDSKIVLSNNIWLHTHKLVLSNGFSCFVGLEMRSTPGRAGGVDEYHIQGIQPQYVQLALKFIYGLDIGIDRMNEPDWLGMIDAAVDLGVHGLVAELCRTPPAVITPLKMIAIGGITKQNKTVLDAGIQRIILQEIPFNPSDMADLSAGAYGCMRNRWIKKQWSTFMLLHIDCCYETHRGTQKLGEKLKDIRFDKFTSEQLAAAAEFPLICDNHLRHMIECMRLRSSA
jgi:hypothetical protein